METLADTIREITRQHIEENNGLVMGQCLSAVGWVNNTVPDCPQGIVELPLTDVAGAGFAVGAALAGRRPILVLRFQDLFMLNCSPILNYAAKSKELHGKPAPVFIRAIASEGLGPVHSGVFHSIPMHFPGIKVFAPMTPGEYREVWQDFMAGDDPVFVSEHRESYGNTEKMPHLIGDDPDIVLFPISITRPAAIEAAKQLRQEGIYANVVHLPRLKPLGFSTSYRPTYTSLAKKGLGLVVDPGFEVCGAAQSIAYELMTQKRELLHGTAMNMDNYSIHALGLGDKTKCLCPPHQNRYPDAERIYREVRNILGGESKALGF